MKHKITTRALAGCLLAAALFSGALTACCALSAQPSDGSGGKKMPPAEALASCKALSSGQECSFTAPHGLVQGSCWAPQGKPLACKPKDAIASDPNAPKQ